MKRSKAKRIVTRRGFLRSAAAAVAAPYVITSEALGGAGTPAASDRITMGGIGMGGRGRGDLNGFMGHREVKVLAVCDVKKGHLDACKNQVNKRYGNSDCQGYTDMRELLDRGDLDAVLVATPDHWHAIACIEACRRGIDVFCEKPLTLTIGEGRQMVEAARTYGCVVSSGSQRVMGDYGRHAQYVASGAIGRITECWVNVGGPSRRCDLPGQPVPEDVAWDLWLGPAPWAPYHPHRCGGAYGLGGKGWRTWYDYSGGMMTDWGGHKFGGAMYAMQLDETGPVEVIPPDGKDVKLLTYVFANGIRMYHGGGGNIRYKGTDGESRGGGNQTEPDPLRRYKGRGGLPGDFLHCVKTREKCFRDFEYAHRVATVCHLGNIAYILKRPLKWDPDSEQFVGDAEANRMVVRTRREPWRV